MSSKKIKCADCVFAQVSKAASEGIWKAYACGSRDSEFSGTLLNVDINGNKQDTVTWTGCEYGRKAVVS